MWKAWMLGSLPHVEWYLPDDPEGWPPMWHMNTEVVEPDGPGACGRGHSLWMAELDGSRIGLAWDWVEVRPGVPALADPNAIFSNIHFVCEDGRPMDTLVATIQANRIVHALPWQDPIRVLLHDKFARGKLPGSSAAAAFQPRRMPADRPALAA